MKIQIIIGSTRPSRVGLQVADWISENLPKHPNTDYEIVDLAEWKLPLMDEPIHPSMSQYQNEHTKAWSEKIKQAGAYVFLTPEYNAGYAAPIKNAIDYLYHEWIDKPVMIVSYGAGGGASASAQLRQVAERLKMRPTELNPTFAIGRDMSGEDGQIKDISIAFEPYVSTLVTAGQQLLDEVNTEQSLLP